MASAIPSIIAVAGTLLGVTITYVFQTRAARQARQAAREERLWQERLAAYSAFAGALTDFRKSQNDRWHREQEDPQSQAFIAARDESYQKRADATSALFRLRLVAANGTLSELASAALKLTEEIALAADEPDRRDLGRKARRALLNFTEAAAAHVRETDSQ
ncbi:hypothetical protein [Nonomuraea cavernae]|uniref:Protein kilB n=1 Tax=Nonomuraea cavernae TaxID=2045107 RepID=A0A917ZA00_9ACTN|nr:hypothetical protein [Nonomuraea cavernae]MCA2186405.1 hypothetical protein [Nonomuraea cavernae]GGO79223.1 hypothetical protein GCM10012289_63010 [Nonomuraea cavernae]